MYGTIHPHLLGKVLGKPTKNDVAGYQTILNEPNGQGLGKVIHVLQRPLDVLVLVADDVNVGGGGGQTGQGGTRRHCRCSSLFGDERAAAGDCGGCRDGRDRQSSGGAGCEGADADAADCGREAHGSDMGGDARCE